jgi:hypothetical protein
LIDVYETTAFVVGTIRVCRAHYFPFILLCSNEYLNR